MLLAANEANPPFNMAGTPILTEMVKQLTAQIGRFASFSKLWDQANSSKTLLAG